MVGRGKSSSAANHKNGHIAAKPKAARGKKHRNENREKREKSTPSSWNNRNIGYGLVVTALGTYYVSTVSITFQITLNRLVKLYLSVG